MYLEKYMENILDEDNGIEVTEMLSQFAIALELEAELRELATRAKKTMVRSKKEAKLDGEKRKGVEIAKKLLEEGLEEAFVFKVTGVSKKEIEE